jgi:hypothetical protein
MTKSAGGGDKPAPELDLDAELAAAVDSATLDKAAEDPALARFAHLIDPQHPVLTVAEQLEAFKKAELKVEAEKRKRAQAELQKKAEQALLGDSGKTTGNAVLDELVWVELNLAPYADHIAINGEQYMHGQRYKVPRHVANTLKDMEARGWEHQSTLDGKRDLSRYFAERKPIISGAAA